MTRRILPQRRHNETFEFRYWNQRFSVTLGFYEDGSLGEVFINSARSGSDIEGTVRDGAVLLSLALQHGASLETIQHAVTRNTDGTASAIFGAIIDHLSGGKIAPAAGCSGASQ